MTSSRPYRYFVLGVLLLAYVFAFIDRQLMSILLEPIKAEFGASDTAMGFLTGLAFALFYATLGVPVARLADNWSRRNVLAISMVVWSAATALCGLAASFWQLALYRVGVGIGEAGGTPPSHSLIASYFPADERATAMGIYGTGSQIGILIGLFGGAVIAAEMGWRWAFILFGVPGVLIGALVAVLVKEPPRLAPPKRSKLSADIARLWRIPSFATIAFATSLTSIAGFGMGTWFPSFLLRVHGLSLTEAGLLLGLAGTTGALIGAVSGGVLCDRLIKKDLAWQLKLPAAGAGLSAIFLGIFLVYPEGHNVMVGELRVPVASAFQFLGAVVSALWIGPAFSAVQTLTPVHLRSQASALLLLLLNLIGFGIGPVLVGFLSDQLTPLFGAQAIRYAMLITLVTVVFGSYLFWRGGAQYRGAFRSHESTRGDNP